MLNRTNRTLSANLPRLNLGTRSLAIVANVNTGAQTLRTRHVHRVVMRDGMLGYQQPSIPRLIMGDEVPAIPGSPAVSSWLTASRSVWPGADLVATLSALTDRLCRPVGPRDSSPRRLRPMPKRLHLERKSFKGKRFHAENDLGSTVARVALATQAAIAAAVGG